MAVVKLVKSIYTNSDVTALGELVTGDTVDLPSGSTLNSGSIGTVTSVAASVPIGLTISGSPVTTSGTLAIAYDTGYAIPTTSKQTNWDSAYGWGNHASAGYLTTATASSTYQPLDGDLTSIAGLAGTSGLLKKTAANTWTLDTSTYLTSAVTSVTGTAPVVSSGGTTPAISMAAANSTTNGYMTSTYAAKLDGIAAGATANTGTVTSVGVSVPTGLSVTGTPVTTSGTIAISMTAGYAIPTTTSQTNWDTAYTDRNKWDGGSTGLTAATGRTSLGLGTAATMAGPSGTIVGTTDTQTLTNKTLTSPILTNAKLTTAREAITVSATASSGTITYDAVTQSVLYYTASAIGNFTMNFRGDGGTTLNTLMEIGESLTVAFLCTNGGTAYYNSAVQVDGSSVTPKWQGGTAPTSGNASSVDIYTYTVVKTANATFTVFASQTKFA